MEHIRDVQLVKKDGTCISSSEALDKKKLVGFYFSAHWCPPCRQFTPVLAQFYEVPFITEVHSEDEDCLEIIFVSSDRSAGDMKSYMDESHGDWLAIPHGDGAVGKLMKGFEVRGIPKLVIVVKDKVVTLEGREGVTRMGPVVIKEWLKQQ
ncbi:unnamed protein product [Cyprideis torosa]|uniref:Uncharacterized protein n=1 Tax=Cyprideis torosa TaxID=163714 RepID=A0A7R8W7X0_9CRUS|nr:unnamed protein product [Cyprideis torosa]CAG0888010.1 unnamed protein product [Cyprideis torosa]